MSAHGVSVVIPVLNEAEQLTRKLPAVLHGQPSEGNVSLKAHENGSRIVQDRGKRAH